MKETTGQTVYEQLQEIQDKIADKTLSFGCKIKHKIHGDGIYIQTSGDRNIGYDCFFFGVSINRGYGDFIQDLENIYIIGHPIYLVRVLSALGEDFGYDVFTHNIYWTESIQQNIKEETYTIDMRIMCNRKLLNEDGSDCMLSDQSPDTIKAIREILCKSEK